MCCQRGKDERKLGGDPDVIYQAGVTVNPARGYSMHSCQFMLSCILHPATGYRFLI